MNPIFNTQHKYLKRDKILFGIKMYICCHEQKLQNRHFIKKKSEALSKSVRAFIKKITLLLNLIAIFFLNCSLMFFISKKNSVCAVIMS